MADLNLTYATGLVLGTIAKGHPYGFEIMELTGLPSGTVYPALRRLEAAGLLRSVWDHSPKEKLGGPPRRCYRVTRQGEKFLDRLRQRYPLLARVQ